MLFAAEILYWSCSSMNPVCKKWEPKSFVFVTFIETGKFYQRAKFNYTLMNYF